MKVCVRHSPPRSQRGMALIAALFLIIVVAALGVFAMRIGADQQQTSALELLNYRAAAAAFSGLEFGSNRAFNGAWPPASPANVTRVINGFTVTIDCGPLGVQIVDGIEFCDLRATAAQGIYGRPDFVQRSLVRRISSAGVGNW